MLPRCGNWPIPCRMAGNQALTRKKATAQPTSIETNACTSNSRPSEAWANAATPRGLIGCQSRGEILDFGVSIRQCDFRFELWIVITPSPTQIQNLKFKIQNPRLPHPALFGGGCCG